MTFDICSSVANGVFRVGDMCIRETHFDRKNIPIFSRFVSLNSLFFFFLKSTKKLYK